MISSKKTEFTELPTGLLSVGLYVVTVLVYEYNFSDLPAFLNENLVL